MLRISLVSAVLVLVVMKSKVKSTLLTVVFVFVNKTSLAVVRRQSGRDPETPCMSLNFTGCIKNGCRRNIVRRSRLYVLLDQLLHVS